MELEIIGGIVFGAILIYAFSGKKSSKKDSTNSGSSKADSDVGKKTMDNVEIMNWKSVLLINGNGEIYINIRNKNSYEVTVDIDIKYNGKWRRFDSFNVDGSKIRKVQKGGKYLKRAEDIRISYVH